MSPFLHWTCRCESLVTKILALKKALRSVAYVRESLQEANGQCELLATFLGFDKFQSNCFLKSEFQSFPSVLNSLFVRFFLNRCYSKSRTRRSHYGNKPSMIHFVSSTCVAQTVTISLCIPATSSTFFYICGYVSLRIGICHCPVLKT